MIIRIGRKVQSIPLILTSFHIDKDYGIFMPATGGTSYKLPLSLGELDIGKYGSKSFIHPTNLPFANSNYVIWKDQSKRLVTHNRTKTLCRLRMTDDFWATGDFTLEPMDSPGENLICRSMVWNRYLLRTHLESLQGKPFTFDLKIVSLVYKGDVLNQILMNNITKNHCVFLVTTTAWDTLFSFPIELLNFDAKNP